MDKFNPPTPLSELRLNPTKTSESNTLHCWSEQPNKCVAKLGKNRNCLIGKFYLKRNIHRIIDIVKLVNFS